MFKNIVVALDGSDHACKAVEVAGDLAAFYDAPVTLVHVRIPGPIPPEVKSGRQILDEAADILAKKGVVKINTELLEGRPADRILALAKRVEADLITLGSRGMGDLKGLLLGSVSHQVSQLADCTCLTVK